MLIALDPRRPQNFWMLEDEKKEIGQITIK